MAKKKVGWIKQLALVEGDINLLNKNEILISKEEDYTILRKKLDSGKIETFVVIPLKDFNNGIDSRKKVEKS
mgnify:CR=1 FL=1